MTLRTANEIHGELFDWELIPTAEDVASGESGLFSHMGAYGEYQKAFINNLAGQNLFLLDTSREYERFPEAHLFLASPTVVGYPQNDPKAENWTAWWGLRKFLRKFDRLLFFDKDVDFKFSAVAGKLQISGEPYWAGVDQPSPPVDSPGSSQCAQRDRLDHY